MTIPPKKIIAHRGAWKDFNFSQNSVAAFLKAQELQLGGVECDLQFTKDGKIIVFHDDTFKGDYISQKRYVRLRGYSFFSNEKVLSFKKLLRYWNGEITLWIELKPSNLNGYQKQEFVRKILKILAHRTANVYFISFDFSLLKEVRKRSNFPCFYLNDNYAVEKCVKNEIFGIDAEFHRYFNAQDLLPKIKEFNMLTNAWTVNDKIVAKKLLDMGIDCITTDEIMLMLKE